jgi:hypothetical protein
VQRVVEHRRVVQLHLSVQEVHQARCHALQTAQPSKQTHA